MQSKNTYVRLLNFLRTTLHEDAGFAGCEDVMAYIHEASAAGTSVKVTDLVQCLQFGTGPTVHRKVTELQRRQLIRTEPSASDGRAKILVLSDAGIKHLDARQKALKAVLQE